MVHRFIERRLRTTGSDADLWRALTDPHQLARWVCENAWIRLEEGSPFRWEWGGGLHADGQVLRLDDGRSLELSYRVPAFQECVISPTRLTFEVSGSANGAELLMRHTEFLPDTSWDSYFAGHRACWDVDLQKLKSLVERDCVGPVLRLELPQAGELGFRQCVERIDNADTQTTTTHTDRELSYETTRDSRPVSVALLHEGESVVITESFEGDAVLRETEQYDRWETLLDGLGPFERGTPYDYS